MEGQVTDVRITSVAGDAQDLARETLDDFAAGLDGTGLYPDDAGFTEAILCTAGTTRPATLTEGGYGPPGKH